MQIRWDHGSCIFKKRLAMCVARDPGSLLHHLFHSSFIFPKSLFLPTLLRCLLKLLTEWFGSRLGPWLCTQKMCWGKKRDLQLVVCHAKDRVAWFDYIVCYLTKLNIFYTEMQPAHEKIGVVDSQWVVHQSFPSLGNQVNPIELSLLDLTLTSSLRNLILFRLM